MIPKDPVICRSLSVDGRQIVEALKGIDYEYDANSNQFI